MISIRAFLSHLSYGLFIARMRTEMKRRSEDGDKLAPIVLTRREAYYLAGLVDERQQEIEGAGGAAEWGGDPAATFRISLQERLLCAAHGEIK